MGVNKKRNICRKRYLVESWEMLTGLPESNYLCFEMWRWVSVFSRQRFCFESQVVGPAAWDADRLQKNAVTSSWERFIPTISGVFLVYLWRMVCCWVYHILLNIPSLRLVASSHLRLESLESLLSASSSVLAGGFPPWHLTPILECPDIPEKYPRYHHLTTISQPFSQDLLTFFTHRSPDRSAGHATTIPGGERLQGSCCSSLESNDRQIT